jgi:hypothetical protein
VIGKCKYLVRVRDRQALLMQRIERMPRTLMNETAIDVEQRLVFLLGDDVFFPYLVEQCNPIRISVGMFAERSVMEPSPMTVTPP